MRKNQSETASFILKINELCFVNRTKSIDLADLIVQIIGPKQCTEIIAIFGYICIL